MRRQSPTAKGRASRCVFGHDHIFIEHNATFASRSGLPESALQRYANAFGRLDVICRSKHVASSHLTPITDRRIQFHPVDNVRSMSGLRRLGRVRAEISRIIAEADCVIARLPSAIGLLCVAEAKRRKCPLLVEVVGNAFQANVHHGSKVGRLTAPLEHALCKAAIWGAPAAVYITDGYLQKVYPTTGRVFVCPNVEIVNALERLPPRRAEHTEHLRWTLGLIGSLDVRYKGHGVAIAALAILRARLPEIDVRLQFVGGGDPSPWRQAGEYAGVSDRIEFVGTLSPGQPVRDWHDSVDIVLQPSQVEAQGRSIIEAMSRARPVLAGAVGGIPELLTRECLVDPADAEALAAKVARLILEPDYYAATAQRNLERSKDFLKPVVEARRAEAFEFLRAQILVAS